jgi:hypothetical protein
MPILFKTPFENVDLLDWQARQAIDTGYRHVVEKLEQLEAGHEAGSQLYLAELRRE